MSTHLRQLAFLRFLRVADAGEVGPDWTIFNAWGREAGSGCDGWVALLSIWALGRAAVEDAAAARRESTEALLDRMTRRAGDIAQTA